jgi:hypothetical protein
MKKWHKILLSIIVVLIVLILISLISQSGRFFWNQAVIVPILKPFSEPCGYGGTSGMEVNCECDGGLISEIAKGSTSIFCMGSCGECTCYNYDFNTKIKTEVDCATFSKISWAFPLK